MPQVMDAHVVEGSPSPDRAPRLLDIGEMRARVLVDEFPWVVFRTVKGGQQVHCGAGERHHPRFGLAVA